MLASFPAAWLLLSLPFVSSLVLRSVPCLWRPAATRNRLMQLIGAGGLACMAAGLVGLVHPPAALPLALAGGAVSGYLVFSVPRGSEGDGDGWRGSGPPPDDPPPPPPGDEPIDWTLFDRLRREWERRPVAPRG